MRPHRVVPTSKRMARARGPMQCTALSKHEPYVSNIQYSCPRTLRKVMYCFASLMVLTLLFMRRSSTRT